MEKQIYVKYGYKRRPLGWEFESYKWFEHFGEALRWVMETKADKTIQGFRVIDIQKQAKANLTYPFKQDTLLARSAYKYEGSTDAELLGMRY